jgi:Fe-S oxidoreductase
MDLLLLFVLSGVGLAIFKRFRSSSLGLKKTTKLRLGDKIALISLWSIFPLRLLAESFTSGIHQSGGFLTGNLGYAFSTFLPLNYLEYGTWWLYSISLGLFFVALPFSRYMHIPTEVLLIFLKNYGIRTQKYYTSISEVEVYSCSRCGICLDSCQLQDANIINPISVYFLRSVRNNSLDSHTAFNCSLCGRCNQVCPVGIDITGIRSAKREHFNLRNKFTYDFPKPDIPAKSKIIYFAGCMTHLTPSIQKSMFQIFKAAGDDFWFMDEEKGVCCGRPLMMAGQHNAALQLINHNRSIINKANADILVTSCPICHKVFSQKYNLSGIKVMHHTEYIDMLIKSQRITLDKLPLTAVYHDPCDLGRGSGIYEQPRSVLNEIVHLRTSAQEKDNALCCGGSLGNFEIESGQRDMIRDAALDVLLEKKPDVLVTACPLCKKTFGKNTRVKVHDISELVAMSLIKEKSILNEMKVYTS